MIRLLIRKIIISKSKFNQDREKFSALLQKFDSLYRPAMVRYMHSLSNASTLHIPALRICAAPSHNRLALRIFGGRFFSLLAPLRGVPPFYCGNSLFFCGSSAKSIAVRPSGKQPIFDLNSVKLFEHRLSKQPQETNRCRRLDTINRETGEVICTN